VIARYLTAKPSRGQKDQSPSLAVTPPTTSSSTKAEASSRGAPSTFSSNPRQNRQGLFKGDLWIDAGTYLRVQESGYLVKSLPSS